MKGIIVDDEPIAHKIITDYCVKSGDIRIIGCFQNPIEAISFLNDNLVDLIFLDINMPDLNGIEFCKSLVSPFKIIVTTAYSDFALESFNFGAIDYLLKPFSFSRFLNAVSKARLYQPFLLRTEAILNETIYIRVNRRQVQISLSSIVYIEAIGNYCKTFTDTSTLITRETLIHFLSVLTNKYFIQIHKSFIINKNYVRSVSNSFVELSTISIPIGKSFRDNVAHFFVT